MNKKRLSVSLLMLLGVTMFMFSCKSNPANSGNASSSLRILPNQTISGNIDNTGYTNFNAQTILADGGSPLHNYGWSVESSPTPPSGVIFWPQTGIICRTGTSSTGLSVGTRTFNVTVSDGNSTATETVTLNITGYTPGPAAAFQQWPLAEFQLKDGEANKSYGASLFAMGGTPPYSWKLDNTYSGSSDVTNASLILDAASGLARGTIDPSASGKTLRFRIIVTDNAGEVASDGPIYTIKVN